MASHAVAAAAQAQLSLKLQPGESAEVEVWAIPGQADGRKVRDEIVSVAQPPPSSDDPHAACKHETERPGDMSDQILIVKVDPALRDTVSLGTENPPVDSRLGLAITLSDYADKQGKEKSSGDAAFSNLIDTLRDEDYEYSRLNSEDRANLDRERRTTMRQEIASGKLPILFADLEELLPLEERTAVNAASGNSQAEGKPTGRIRSVAYLDPKQPLCLRLKNNAGRRESVRLTFELRSCGDLDRNDDLFTARELFQRQHSRRVKLQEAWNEIVSDYAPQMVRSLEGGVELRLKQSRFADQRHAGRD